MLLVTHTDLDGVGCEIVLRCFYPKVTAKDIYHCDYHTVDKTVIKLLENTEEQLFISDVSVTKETATVIEEKYKQRVKLYDHHRTAEEYLKGYSWVIVDTSKSATQILFDDLRKNNPKNSAPMGLPMFVFYVNDYDLWHQTMSYSTSLNDLVSLLGIKIFARIILERLRKDKPLISTEDKIHIEALNLHKKRYFEERIERSIVIGNRLVILANRHLSDMAQFVRDIKNPPGNWKNVEYIDMINLERGSHSLRSYNDEFDVSEVAKNNGGGGHPKAAGYPAKPMEIEQLKNL